VAKKSADRDRRAKIAEMQRQAKAAERRRTLLIVGTAIAVVVVIAGAVGFAILRDPNRRPSGALNTLGVSASAAACSPVTNDKASGGAVHVGPGTQQPGVTRVKYSTVPPTSGEHFATPEYPNRQFYTVSDRPKMETLVHNLEHGYTILWYDASATAQQKATLKSVAEKANATSQARDKFIVSAWDPTYGAFPAGKHFALSHWAADPQDLTKQSGHRQLCGDVSGDVVQKFITAYPRTSAPEPNAQ
jgi:Protein of unknown function (DUF3105)